MRLEPSTQEKQELVELAKWQTNLFLIVSMVKLFRLMHMRL